LEQSRKPCPRCGEIVDEDEDQCASCGTVVGGADSDSHALTGTAFLDTVHLEQEPGDPGWERIVRPSLAILFRTAVGPAADYYAPRFLEYERIGRSFPSWNWAAPWVPTVWAFYHKLWGAGAAFALWPIAAMTIFARLDPYLGDSTLSSLATAAALLWALPGIVAGLIANTLVYHRTRRLVRDAEAETLRPDEAARLLGERSPIALGTALALGSAALVLAQVVVAPNLQTALADRVVRTRVAEAVAALRPLQRQVEEGWNTARSSLMPQSDQIAIWTRAADFISTVDVNPENGRLRVALGPTIPEVSGRSILLAPAVDRDERIRWICVPVGIPARYLPHDCRRG
jgi:hypothetical protein